MYKRQESLADRFFRFRGLSILVTAPLVIIALYIFIFPRSSPTDIRTTASEQYAVVFDAGSSGSRVHVFNFAKGPTDLVLLSDTFERLTPGLGHEDWAADPEKSAASIKPLLEKAIAAVPESHQATTPVELRATAGLRLLPGKQADDILEAVTKILEASPFKLVKDGVTIMGGIDEGAFAWLTLNYLLGKTGKAADELVGAIDLGGGSVQQAFAVDEKTASNDPDGTYIREMSGGGKKYHVYVYSYLGYGLMQGRGAVLEESNSDSCINAGTTGHFKSPYGDNDIPLKPAPEGADSGKCSAAVEQALKLGESCGAEADLCTFNGAWGAVESHRGRKFYVSSFFFDRAVGAGIVADENAKQAVVTPAAFEEAAKQACALNVDAVVTAFPAAGKENAPFLCLDLSFQATLLTEGLKVPKDQEVTLVQQVKYNGEYFEAAWPLGAAINTLATFKP